MQRKNPSEKTTRAITQLAQTASKLLAVKDYTILEQKSRKGITQRQYKTGANGQKKEENEKRRSRVRLSRSKISKQK